MPERVWLLPRFGGTFAGDGQCSALLGFDCRYA
ncbi:hypothetical protein GGQ81_002413 [Sphingomonas desiccabilis]|nr:hypothetical protein [Sphingomonas desiccabilis]